MYVNNLKVPLNTQNQTIFAQSTAATPDWKMKLKNMVFSEFLNDV